MVRNKIYVWIICGIFVVMLAWCPLVFGLEMAGIVRVSDDKSYLDTNKIYENEYYISIENDKNEITDIHTGYKAFIDGSGADINIGDLYGALISGKNAVDDITVETLKTIAESMNYTSDTYMALLSKINEYEFADKNEQGQMYVSIIADLELSKADIKENYVQLPVFLEAKRIELEEVLETANNFVTNQNLPMDEANGKAISYIEDNINEVNIVIGKIDGLIKTGEIIPESAYNRLIKTIESGKNYLNDIYTKYLPAYRSVTTNLKSFETDSRMNFLQSIKPKTAAESFTGEDTPDEDNPDEEIQKPKEIIEYETIMVRDDGLHRYYAISSPQVKFLDTALSWERDKLTANMEKQIDHLNRIIAANNDVNFYLYVFKRMQDTEYFSDIVKGEESTVDLFNEFMGSIEGATGKDYFKIDTLEQRLERIFLTDHHWSALGAYSGYSDIINMVNKVTPQIGNPIPLKGLITYPDVELRGSASRISQFSLYYEPFSVMDIDLPKGKPGNMVTDESERYDSGKSDRSKYADHYEIYYHVPGKIVYPTNNTGRNLLIICDSYSWWSSWLIAANFDTTYTFFPWDGKKLNYNEYIAANNITDVLYMQFSDRVMFNIYNDCPLRNIITE